jgi:hypothetical protein
MRIFAACIFAFLATATSVFATPFTATQGCHAWMNHDANAIMSRVHSQRDMMRSRLADLSAALAQGATGDAVSIIQGLSAAVQSIHDKDVKRWEDRRQLILDHVAAGECEPSDSEAFRQDMMNLEYEIESQRDLMEFVSTRLARFTRFLAGADRAQTYIGQDLIDEVLTNLHRVELDIEGLVGAQSLY